MIQNLFFTVILMVVVATFMSFLYHEIHKDDEVQ